MCTCCSQPHAVVWDAYVESSANRVYLIDLAPFHESTDPILFDWPTLNALAASALGMAPAGAATAGNLEVRPSEDTGSSFLAAAALRAVDAHVGTAASLVNAADVSSSGAARRVAELRLVEEQGLTPTSQMYYGLPHDFREGEAKDLAALIANARVAAGDQAKAEEDGPTGSESESHDATE